MSRIGDPRYMQPRDCAASAGQPSGQQIIAAARQGNPKALDAMERWYEAVGHGPNCRTRDIPAGKCDCIRSAIAQTLIEQGRDV